MDIITATTTATSTVYRLTDEALDLINFNYQLLVFFACIFIGLGVLFIVLNIFD